MGMKEEKRAMKCSAQSFFKDSMRGLKNDCNEVNQDLRESLRSSARQLQGSIRDLRRFTRDKAKALKEDLRHEKVALKYKCKEFQTRMKGNVSSGLNYSL